MTKKDRDQLHKTLTITASQLIMGLMKRVTSLRLDAIPCPRDRASIAFGDQRHHPCPREVTSQPTVWNREVMVEDASH